MKFFKNLNNFIGKCIGSDKNVVTIAAGMTAIKLPSGRLKNEIIIIDQNQIAKNQNGVIALINNIENKNPNLKCGTCFMLPPAGRLNYTSFFGFFQEFYGKLVSMFDV